MITCGRIAWYMRELPVVTMSPPICVYSISFVAMWPEPLRS